jgi:hypothetical protein
VEEHPSAVDGATALAEGGGLAFSRRRKTTRVSQSWPKCTGPVSVGDRKNGGRPHEGMCKNQRIKKNGLFKWF